MPTYLKTNWEEQFREWAKPPGKTEQNRCDNAVSAIRNAIKANAKLNKRNITIFSQGSYRNNTNVRQDSDVDIGVLCTEVFFYELPEKPTKETFEIKDATYHYDQFKNEVEEALVDYFGRNAVKRDNKAFDIHETSSHVEADVAALFEHRRYLLNGSYLEGVELRTDREKSRVINWPEQHYKNGVTKNTDTGTRFKSIVRVLKALSNQMNSEGIRAAEVPSFLIECLVWNASNNLFQHSAYTEDVRASLAFLFNNTIKIESCTEWGEVSELKYLFRPAQKWTKEQAHNFISAAWDYLGFE